LKIQQDIAYQRQEETLIAWTENEMCDVALSFQEKAGCDDIWEKICQVQGQGLHPHWEFIQEEEGTDDRFEEVSDSDVAPMELPPCELSKLEEIGELFSSCLSSIVGREKLALALEQEDYIHKLIELFHVCEDLENDSGLHHLYEIFKVIFLLNQTSLYEVMFHDDVIFDVVGVLEYDPSKSEPIRHRDYLATKACFKEVVPIKDPDLLAKIHQTYRIQYVQDIILPTPSVFEENLLTSLTSLVFFNKAEIMAKIQEDDEFLDELFAQLKNESAATVEQKRDSVLFVKELCTFSQALKPPDRSNFLKKLTCRSLLPVLGTYMRQLDDPRIQQATIDILNMFADSDPSTVRDSMLAEASNEVYQCIYVYGMCTSCKVCCRKGFC
jgi:protein phosphatase-4 regulatory subunit 3